jgi:hypothetical protein
VGGRGSIVRRSIILIEFVVEAVVGIALGVWMLAGGPSDWLVVALGVWAIGVGINQVPLALHAIDLSPPRETGGGIGRVDMYAELSH